MREEKKKGKKKTARLKLLIPVIQSSSSIPRGREPLDSRGGKRKGGKTKEEERKTIETHYYLVGVHENDYRLAFRRERKKGSPKGKGVGEELEAKVFLTQLELYLLSTLAQLAR